MGFEFCFESARFVNFLDFEFYRLKIVNFVNFFWAWLGFVAKFGGIFWNLKFGFGFVNFGLRFEGKFFLQNFAFACFLDLAKFVNFLGMRFGFGVVKFVINFLGLNFGLNLRKFGLVNFLFVVLFWILA